MKESTAKALLILAFIGWVYFTVEGFRIINNRITELETELKNL